MGQKVYSKIYEAARQQERERVRRFIEDIKNDLAGAPFFLNLFAPKGFGKTVFLEQVWDDYERVLPATMVRIGDFIKKDDKDIVLKDLLILIIHDLAESLPRRVAPLSADYADWTNEEQLVKLLLTLVAGAKDFEKLTLFLIDDYDLLSEEQRRWFQGNIFGPASRMRKVAFVLTSETELRFTESFELRMLLECLELKSLDAESISRALPDYEEIAEEIHTITGGLPLLTEEFIKQIKASQVVTSADFQFHAQELTKNYYRTYVEDVVLADFSPDIRETVLVLALLRRFDVKVLKEILPNLLPKLYQKYGTANYLDLIDRLRPWVQWRRQGGYALNPAFQMLLQGYVFTIRPPLYKQVNRVVEVLYRKWLENEYREYYLIELMYHVLALHRTENVNGFSSEKDEMSQDKAEDELQKYLKGSSGHRLQEADLDSLRNSLDQDSDLKNYIPDEVKRVILELIDQRVKEAREEHVG